MNSSESQLRPCEACDRGEKSVTPSTTPKNLSMATGVAVHQPSGMLCTRTMSDEMWAIHQKVFGGKP